MMVRGLVHQGPELIAQHSRQALGLAGTIVKLAKHALSIPKSGDYLLKKDGVYGKTGTPFRSPISVWYQRASV